MRKSKTRHALSVAMPRNTNTIATFVKNGSVMTNATQERKGIPMGKWEDVSSDLGNITLELELILHEVCETAWANQHDVWKLWGWGPKPEHNSRNAGDLMVHNAAAGDFVRDYVWANRDRFRLKHVIWEQHITSTVTQPGVRRAMEDRGNVTANHFDHVHMLRFDGPFTATAPTPVPTGYLGKRELRWVRPMNLTGPDVTFVQKFIGIRCGAPDGVFGRQSDAGVRWYQGMRGIGVDGIVGPETWSNMGVAWKG